MKVIVDNNIPYIKETLNRLADEVIYMSGSAITSEIVKDADALIVRTRTICNWELLEGSKVRFIGTATIGFDHIDTEYCEKAGIAWSNCPGCNAGAVEQYLHAALLLLQGEKNMKLEGACIGIVGVGHVGKRVAHMAASLGMRVLLNDPPLADKGGQGYSDLQTLAEECDVITFHTPLCREGVYRTYHLGDSGFFHSLKNTPYIINTSRGEVIDTKAILHALDNREISGAIIDVWENEPHISLDLLDKVYIGTPHIAGYSADGKANATQMVLEAFCRFFGKEIDFHITPPLDMPSVVHNGDVLQRYNPHRDSQALRAHPESFEYLRSHYPLRRE